jgi:hypothetical protein
MLTTFTFGSSKCAWCFLNMGFGKFVVGNATFPNEEIASADYNEK